jgi:hypothetical protein
LRVIACDCLPHQVNASCAGKKLADFKSALKAKEWAAITALRHDVEAFSAQVR